jgi:hypothetical protein
VEDWLRHEPVQNQDVVLLLEEKIKAVHEIVLKQLTFGNQRVYLFSFNLPTNSVNQKSNLDGVVLAHQWILFWLF